MIYWVINLLDKSLTSKIHVFCLDFASALLANIIHTPSTIQFLESNPMLTTQVKSSEYINRLLDYGIFAKIDQRKYSSFSLDAPLDRALIPFKGELP